MTDAEKFRYMCTSCGERWARGTSCPKCGKRILSRADMLRMNIPEEYWRAKLDYVSETARKSVKTYLKNIDEAVANGAGLIIHGGRGVGKTSIAVMVAKEARAWRYTVLFTRLWELREMIRSRIPYDAETMMAERVREVTVLVLDDLRQEDVTEKFFTLSEINQLVKYRASRRKLTIVTTRLPMQTLESSPLDALSDVLLLFPVEGRDLHEVRKQKLEQSILGTTT